jgi:hypothetical protein
MVTMSGGGKLGKTYVSEIFFRRGVDKKDFLDIIRILNVYLRRTLRYTFNHYLL